MFSLLEGNDSLFLNITLHICGQVKILKSKLIKFDLTKPQINDRLNTLIKRHSHLMEMTKILANAISFILLMQLFLSSLLLCILGEYLIDDNETKNKYLIMIYKHLNKNILRLYHIK